MILIISDKDTKEAHEITYYFHNPEQKALHYVKAQDKASDPIPTILKYAANGEKFTVITTGMILETNQLIQTVQPGQQFHQ